jgi:hypothetical protein
MIQCMMTSAIEVRRQLRRLNRLEAAGRGAAEAPYVSSHAAVAEFFSASASIRSLSASCGRGYLRRFRSWHCVRSPSQGEAIYANCVDSAAYGHSCRCRPIDARGAFKALFDSGNSGVGAIPARHEACRICPCSPG